MEIECSSANSGSGRIRCVEPKSFSMERLEFYFLFTLHISIVSCQLYVFFALRVVVETNLAPCSIYFLCHRQLVAQYDAQIMARSFLSCQALSLSFVLLCPSLAFCWRQNVSVSLGLSTTRTHYTQRSDINRLCRAVVDINAPDYLLFRATDRLSDKRQFTPLLFDLSVLWSLAAGHWPLAKHWESIAVVAVSIEWIAVCESADFWAPVPLSS